MNAVLDRLTPRRTAARRRPRAELLLRSCAAHVSAFARDRTPAAAAEALFPGDHLLRGYMALQKAAVDPALTTVPEWAGNLAREQWVGFLELMAPQCVYAQLAALGASFNFEGGKVRFPSRDNSPNLAGDFIGENAAIPVRKASLKAGSLAPRKVAVITALSREVSEATGGGLVAYLQDAMTADTARVLDARLLDNVAASAVRPAGLLNGATVTPSAGTTPADIATDVRAALAPVYAAGGGRRVALLMHPLQAASMALQTDVLLRLDAGRVVEVVVSVNVPLGTLIALDVADFVTVADDAPQFYVSNESTLHMDDAAEPINDGTMASPVINLFQQDAIGVRLLQQINWAMRRAGLVSAVTGIAW